MKQIIRLENSRPLLAKFLPVSLLGVSTGKYQKPLVDESGMIRTQMGKAQLIRSGRSVWDALHATTR
jgi:hypothetical protein